MSRPARLGELSGAEWQELQALLDRFEHAARANGRADLRAFLPPADDRLRLVALLEMIKSELEARWKRGERALLEEYLRTFPELRQEPGLWATLLAEEYRVRRLYGDSPPLAEYRERFPSQFTAVVKLTGEQAPPPPPAAARPAPAAGLLGLPQRDGLLALGGGYKLLERLGSGTFGEVWRTEAPGGVPVAVKVIFRTLDDDEAQRELTSLNLIRNLGHAFLLRLQGFWTTPDNRLVMAMELADGSLRGRLQACVHAGLHGIPVPELLGYMREACEALDYAHGEGVLHRDIKPDNILLLKGHVKVGDFGLACMLEDAASFTATTCGSAPYMAPEVWVGRAGAQTDQYSLAATYVHLRLNRLPFPAGNLMEMALRHQHEPPDLDGLAEAERQVLLRAMAKDPAQRYPRCQDFAEALAQALNPLTEWPTVRRSVPGPGAPVPVAPPPPPMPGAGTVSSVSQAPTLTAGGQPAAAAVPSAPPTAVPPPPRPRWRRWAWLGVPAALLSCLVVAAFAFHPVPLPPSTPGTTQQVSAEPTPSVPAIPLPAGWEPEPDPTTGKAAVETIDRKPVYTRLAYVPPDGDVRVVFLLMKHETDRDPPPFYIMRNKVSNRVYGEVIQAHKDPPWDEAWKKGGLWDGRDLFVGGIEQDNPVYRVSVDEAHRFACLLGGELPTPRQWDKAAGRFAKGQRGPFKGSVPADVPADATWEGDFALRDTGPLAVGTARRDRSCFGCEDMASNGLEWTCHSLTLAPPNPPEEHRIDFSRKDPVAVVVRGASYKSNEPLLFDKMVGLPQDRFDDGKPATPYEVSFRAVLPVPFEPVQ